jgi:phospholipase C
MKLSLRLLLPALALSTLFANAQGISQGTFKHIIIVVQENRTPDNLFGAMAPTGTGGGGPTGTCYTEHDFMPGVDIVDGGYGYYYDSIGNPHYGLICNVSLPLSGWDASIPEALSIDPGHEYEDWVADFTGSPGSIVNTGFCHEFYPYGDFGGQCPSYSYATGGDVSPYFAIAENYGFANYMFQSSEGPSQPAHQFLFTGTSAPDDPSQPYYQYFVADLPPTSENVPVTCNATNPNNMPPWVNPYGILGSPPTGAATECFTHDSLVTDSAACNGGKDSCDRGIPGISPSYNVWGYYAEPSAGPVPQSIWDAPANIPEACYGQATQYGPGQNCGTSPAASEWNDHLRIPQGTAPWSSNFTYSLAPIFDDLFNCELPAISWVIPDQSYSDHPWSPTNCDKAGCTAIGPSWVGDIINAVGGGMYESTCNPPSTTNAYYWTQEPTAILVVWDDWGGWYDHITPWIARQEAGSSPYSPCNPDTEWGCGYTDGFRVPFLVVSPYTPAGYISGECGVTGYPACGSSSNQPPKYVHDFGSILAFTEWNFGMPVIDPPGPNNFGYADSNAPDSGTPSQPHIPLSDFFGSSSRSFTSINTPYDYTCFTLHEGCPLANGWVATPPDSD